MRAVVAGTVKELIDAGKVRYFGLSEAGPHLAWLLTRGEHFVPIPGTRSPKRVEENVGAAVVTLTEAGLTAVDEILPHGGFGARYAGGHVPTWI
ncbi:hypothetical protein GCM10010251_46610 [Streptomyces aurantiogriseus]|uniref:Uncharacterized protein n=1 Tax=Streptomyces aurantiogriseus TaxID=66870 RepID=A0A918CIA8_9ACTN|nr:hypothetical protein GCM10010251_46610 [Streptomyces aurantiogriseus]